MTSANCERLLECARTQFKQSQANSFNKCKNYLLVQSSRSAVLKILTAQQSALADKLLDGHNTKWL